MGGDGRGWSGVLGADAVVLKETVLIFRRGMSACLEVKFQDARSFLLSGYETRKEAGGGGRHEKRKRKEEGRGAGREEETQRRRSEGQSNWVAGDMKWRDSLHTVWTGLRTRDKQYACSASDSGSHNSHPLV